MKKAEIVMTTLLPDTLLLIQEDGVVLARQKTGKSKKKVINALSAYADLNGYTLDRSCPPGAKGERTMSDIKLFVWEGDGVLQDYTSGMVCVLASSEREAWNILYKYDPLAYWALTGRSSRHSDPVPDFDPSSCKNENIIHPKKCCVTAPAVFVCWGGG